MEVVQRIGYDSFCPDNGVLIAKNKDKESRNGGPNGFNCFNWVIDAHPEDINMVDYIRPDGTPAMRTIADYRQLNDALFHAGINSGSLSEWEDAANKLHFYIIDVQKNAEGILTYTIGVRSLTGSGLIKRDFTVNPLEYKNINDKPDYRFFTIKNTGEPSVADPTLHHQNTVRWLNNDIYRLSVAVEGEGWSAKLLNGFASLGPGETETVPVFLSREAGSSRKATVTLSVQSEDDQSKKVSSVLKVKGKLRFH